MVARYFAMTEPAGQRRLDRRGVLSAAALLLTGAYARASPPALSATPPRRKTGTLRFYDWPDYVSPRTYAGFTKASGIDVERTYYVSNEVLLDRLRSGEGPYDLAVPTGYMAGTLVEEGLLRRIDWTKLPNVRRNADPKFLSLPHDPKNRYSVAKDWGTTGFMYRTDKIRERPRTWAQFFSLFRRYPRKFTLLDGSAEVIGSIAVMMGYSYNTDSDKELERVRAFLLGLRPFVHSIDSVGYKSDIVKGRAYGGLGWNGDGAYVVVKSPDNAARYVVAEDGGEFWVDTYVIPKRAKNPAAAHAWIDFVYRPKWSAEETIYTYYGSPLRRAALGSWLPRIVLADRSLFPAPRTMRRLEANALSQKGAARRARIWSEFKNA
jgi:spermidine/putrescine transport system substrate-binding protein